MAGFAAIAGFMDLTLQDKEFQQGLGKVNSSLKSVSQSMQAVSKRAALMLAGGVVAIGGFVKLQAEQEKAEQGLAAALKRTGDFSEEALQDLKDFASGIQEVTVFGDEMILSQITIAKNLGVNTDQLKDATTASIGLAKIIGKDLNTAFLLVARAAVGDTASLKRYGITLDETLSSQEKFNAVLKLGADGFQLAEAETETLAGSMTQLKNLLGDLGESIGAVFIDTVKKGTDRLKEIVPPIIDWITANKQTVFTLTALAGGILGVVAVLGPLSIGIVALSAALTFLAANPVILVVAGIGTLVAALTAFFVLTAIEGDTFKEKMTNVFAFVTLVFTEFADTVELVKTVVELDLLVLQDTFDHIFTVAIPESMAILLSLFERFGEGIEALVVDIREFMEDPSKGLTFTNVADAFEDEMKRLRKVADIEFSATTLELFAQADVLTRGLLDKFGKIKEGLTGALKVEAGPGGRQDITVTPEVGFAAPAVVAGAPVAAIPGVAGRAPTPEFVGLQDLSRRIQTAGTEEKEVLEIAKKQVEVAKRQEVLAEVQVDNLGKILISSVLATSLLQTQGDDIGIIRRP